MGEMNLGGQVPDEPISLVRVYSEFVEFRGETTAHRDALDRRFGSLERSISVGLQDIREAAAGNRGSELRLQHLEAADLPDRLGSLESRWRIAVWLASAFAIAGLSALGALFVAWVQAGG
jgi:hypothetical protein